SLLRVVYGASGVALILVDGSGENMIVVAPGANAALTSLTGPELAAVAEADVLLLQLEVPVETVAAAATVARDAGTRVVLNAAPGVWAVDSTAAGDAFTAALAVGWGEGRPLVDAVRWASAAGAAATRRLGASSALPDRAEIDNLYLATYPHD